MLSLSLMMVPFPMAIFSLFTFVAVFYRGVDLSPREIEHMELLQNFYIPSFTSTSLDREKAYSKPCLLVIKTPYLCRAACSVTPELSQYVLSPCLSTSHMLTMWI